MNIFRGSSGFFINSRYHMSLNVCAETTRRRFSPLCSSSMSSLSSKISTSL